MNAREDGERGAAATELVLLTPALVVMLLFVAALGRIAGARAGVDAAARDAARAASNARSAMAAVRDGDAAARAALDEGGPACRSLSVALDVTRFREGGDITATVSCTVRLDDLTGIALPAARTITARFTEPLDRYRGLS